MNKSIVERLENAKIYLIRNKPFFGYQIPKMEFVETLSKLCPTIGIDYRGKVIYSPEFINTLTDDQLKGVLCHELMHFVLAHHIRAKEFKNHAIANIAQDMVINDILINLEGMTVIPCIDMLDMRKEISQLTDQNNNSIEGFYANPRTGKFTVITYNNVKVDIDVRGQCWEYVYDCLMALLARDDMQSSFNTNYSISSNGEVSDSLGNSFDKHEWAPENLSDEEKQQLEDLANDMLTDAKIFDDKKKNRSSDGSCWLDRLVDDRLKPQINWKSELKRVIQAADPFDYTYIKPNKRAFSIGTYLPSLLKESFYITLAIDVSMSISDSEFAMFIAEIKGIIQSKSNIRVRTLYWSTKVDKTNDKTFRRNNLNSLSTTLSSIKSDGCTHLSCVEYYLRQDSTLKNKKDLDTIIYLTDGYVECDPILWPSKNKIFVITSAGSDDIVKKYGKVIRLNDRC